MTREQNGDDRIFRQEAIAHAVSGRRRDRGVLRLSPAWLDGAYRTLIVVTVLGLAAFGFGRVTEYATGPAVVRAYGRLELTTPQAGTVRSIEVRSGDHVTAGQLLVACEDGSERAEYDRVNRQFEYHLVNSLRSPLDETSRESVAALRSQRDFAKSQLESRQIRAPQAGVIGEIHTRVGQSLQPGQIALTLLDEDGGLGVVSLLPGQVRPQLAAGQPARLELQGYLHAFQEVTVEAVSDEILGPAEARRLLGPDVADGLAVAGPLVVVTVRLPTSSFTADGTKYAYYDGMHATLAVRGKHEPLLLRLLPGLRVLTERRHG
jgi:membrane fusion protein (multidrug efflux system)